MDELLKSWHDRTSVPPVAKLLGANLEEYGEGRATMTMEATAVHHNAMGTLHGGLLGALADMAVGAALATTLEKGESFTTLTLNANYLRAVIEGPVTATAEVIRRGRRTALVRCRVDHGDRHVAEFDSNCVILRPDD
jgi:uncharacterized protein (TIGR00369 family)